MPGAKRGTLGHYLLGTFDDLQEAMARALEERPLRSGLGIALAVVVAWFVYVPIHELLHVLGCVATGGRVSELQVDPLYGGALLARVFDFVVVGDGAYAGRLSGFDTGGSDLVYLATDLGPYLLSIFIGIPVLRACAVRSRPLTLGFAAVVALAPFYNAPGDYYEMGSILVTRLAAWASGAGLDAWEGLRSDDVMLLIESLSADPENLGLASAGAAEWSVVALGLISGVALAFLTAAAGVAVADVLTRASALTRAGAAGPESEE